MVYSKDNIIHGDELPDYLLNSKTNLSQFFIRLLGDHGNKTAMVFKLIFKKQKQLSYRSVWYHTIY